MGTKEHQTSESVVTYTDLFRALEALSVARRQLKTASYYLHELAEGSHLMLQGEMALLVGGIDQTVDSLYENLMRQYENGHIATRASM